MTDIESFAEILNTAVKGVFPNKAKTTYRRVYVLLLYWEDDNLGCVTEVDELDQVCQNIYHFTTKVYRIPSEKSHNRLNSEIARFIAEYDDKANLLLVYYGGHGWINADRQCVWL
ncbi:MAG: hypothetical protein M1835_003057, partial [Candelina submexicana]